MQNLDAENAWKGLDSEQKDMIGSLKTSLQLMEKVLNDVLSLNRLEAGKLSQIQAPFDFHSMVKLAVMSHRSQAKAVGLNLGMELDPAIDALILFGDEMRLRQLLGNLVNNACKFTPKGSVTVVTKLLHPVQSPPTTATSAAFSLISKPSETGHPEIEQIHDGGLAQSTPSKTANPTGPRLPEDDETSEDRISGKAVIRVEVRDTGVGISTKDAQNSNLFSPYQQTEIGLRQAGKGSGLGKLPCGNPSKSSLLSLMSVGLALCQQLVALFKGRLGVDSQVGQGSTFW